MMRELNVIPNGARERSLEDRIAPGNVRDHINLCEIFLTQLRDEDDWIEK